MIALNNSNFLRVAVTGVTGRMGKEIIQCIIDKKNPKINEKLILGAAIVKNQSKFCGMNISAVVQSDISEEIIITDDIKSVKDFFDILVDFTTPTATMEYLNFCVAHRKNMIIGTTGLNDKHMSLIKQASKKIGIVYSANFSIGITVMLRLLKEMTRKIGNLFDINIIETHHNKKKDIPSGTALMIRDVIKHNLLIESKSIRDGNLNCNIDLEQQNKLHMSLSQSICDIKICSIRSGDIVGEHTVLFASRSGERLEITHKASNRSIFANGALYSAIWLRDKRTGLFSLNNVLGF